MPVVRMRQNQQIGRGSGSTIWDRELLTKPFSFDDRYLIYGEGSPELVINTAYSLNYGHAHGASVSPGTIHISF